MADSHSLSILVPAPLDLVLTLDSGQAFRWHHDGEWSYGVIQGNLVGLKQEGTRLEVRSSLSDPERAEAVLRDYLRLDDDLETICAAINTDPYIGWSIDRYPGLRVLRQDPWECLVSFICSANSNIPRIRWTMNSLAREYGDPLELDGHTHHLFPKPEALAEAGEANLRALKMGFRAKYVAEAAEKVAAGDVKLWPLREASYEEAKETLMSLNGVGEKVADCVLLFSLDKMSAFPIDRWIRRAMEEWYLDGAKLNYKNGRIWSVERWGEYAGYANQYLFQLKRLEDKG